MRKIRRSVFETNSSSTHSITICTETEFDLWKKGEMYWDRWNDKLVSKDVAKSDEESEYNKIYYSYSEYLDLDYETYEEEYTTPKNEKIVAFGYYGYD